MGGIQYPSTFFVYNWPRYVYRASSVWSNTCNNSRFVHRELSAAQLALCLSSRVLSWTVSECEQKRRVHWRELSIIHFSCKCNYSILLNNKTPIYSAWGILSVCAAYPTPCLKHSYKFRPPWEQHLICVPHRDHNGYNTLSPLKSIFKISISLIQLYKQGAAASCLIV